LKTKNSAADSCSNALLCPQSCTSDVHDCRAGALNDAWVGPSQLPTPLVKLQLLSLGLLVMVLSGQGRGDGQCGACFWMMGPKFLGSQTVVSRETSFPRTNYGAVLGLMRLECHLSVARIPAGYASQCGGRCWRTAGAKCGICPPAGLQSVAPAALCRSYKAWSAAEVTATSAMLAGTKSAAKASGTAGVALNLDADRRFAAAIAAGSWPIRDARSGSRAHPAGRVARTASRSSGSPGSGSSLRYAMRRTSAGGAGKSDCIS